VTVAQITITECQMAHKVNYSGIQTTTTEYQIAYRQRQCQKLHLIPSIGIQNHTVTHDIYLCCIRLTLSPKTCCKTNWSSQPLR